MSIKYTSGNSCYAGNIMAFLWGDPFAYKSTVESEMQLRQRSTNDPEGPPKPERGDKYIIIGAVVGIIIGCTAGVFIGNHLFGIGGVFLGLGGGAIIGGIIGITTGSYIKKRTNKTPPKRADTDEQGPIIR